MEEGKARVGDGEGGGEQEIVRRGVLASLAGRITGCQRSVSAEE